MTSHDDDKTYWLDDPKAPELIWRVLVAVCVLLTLADLFYEKHTHFAFEGWFGFYGFYGFIACVALVVAAKQMRRFLMRDEDYYDDE
jgi:hypothetical protein